MTLIEVRKAVLGDAKRIAEFNQLMAHETEGKVLEDEVIQAGVKSLMDSPSFGFYLVAQMDSKVVGSLMITMEFSDWRNGVFWWIQSVYVDTEYRRRGIYKKMYDVVKTLAEKEPRVCGFRLYVERENTRAQETYVSLGMKECGYKMYEETSR